MDEVKPAATSRGAAIHGLTREPLRVIPTNGGAVLHMMRADAPWFSGFGESYFSEVRAGMVRAWKRHRVQTQNFAVPVGRVIVVLYDDREGSPTRGALAEHLLGRPEGYDLLRIPPGLWYGFAALDGRDALIANCTDLPHDPAESDRLPEGAEQIPYRWSPCASW